MADRQPRRRRLGDEIAAMLPTSFKGFDFTDVPTVATQFELDIVEGRESLDTDDSLRLKIVRVVIGKDDSEISREIDVLARIPEEIERFLPNIDSPLLFRARRLWTVDGISEYLNEELRETFWNGSTSNDNPEIFSRERLNKIMGTSQPLREMFRRTIDYLLQVEKRRLDKSDVREAVQFVMDTELTAALRIIINATEATHPNLYTHLTEARTQPWDTERYVELAQDIVDRGPEWLSQVDRAIEVTQRVWEESMKDCIETTLLSGFEIPKGEAAPSYEFSMDALDGRIIAYKGRIHNPIEHRSSNSIGDDKRIDALRAAYLSAAVALKREFEDLCEGYFTFAVLEDLETDVKAAFTEITGWNPDSHEWTIERDPEARDHGTELIAQEIVVGSIRISSPDVPLVHSAHTHYGPTPGR